MIRIMPTMTGSSVIFLLNKEWFYKHDLQSPNAIQWIFQVYFSEESLGLYRIELIVVASSDASSFRKRLRKSINQCSICSLITYVQYLNTIKVAFRSCVLLCSTNICESRKIRDEDMQWCLVKLHIHMRGYVCVCVCGQ